MSREEAIKVIKEHIDTYIVCHGEEDTVAVSIDNVDVEAFYMAIKALEQDPCGDCISRSYLLDVILLHNFHGNDKNIVPYADRRGYRQRDREIREAIINAPSVSPMPKMERCKDCKYFEYDTLEKVNGKLIFAHEICSRWGDGCQTKKDGYCFLFEPQAERGDKE